jgi:hypothetical protein
MSLLRMLRHGLKEVPSCDAREARQAPRQPAHSLEQCETPYCIMASEDLVGGRRGQGTRQSTDQTIVQLYIIIASITSSMTVVDLEMKPFSGSIDLSRTALIIIDMQAGPRIRIERDDNDRSQRLTSLLV